MIEQGNDLEKCDIIEILEDYIHIHQIENIILKSLHDKKYIVRCEVCDTLRNSRSVFIFNKVFRQLTKEKSRITRMYIISSLCSMCCNNNELIKYLDKKKIRSMRKGETSIRVLLAYNILYYIFTKDISYIKEDLKYINYNNYHIRCCVVNLLYEAINIHTYVIIYKAYVERIKVERVRYMCSVLEEGIDYIKKEFNILREY